MLISRSFLSLPYLLKALSQVDNFPTRWPMPSIFWFLWWWSSNVPCQEWSGCLSSGAVHQVVLKNQALLRFKPPIHSFSDNIYKIHYVLSCLGNPSLVLVEHGYNAAYLPISLLSPNFRTGSWPYPDSVSLIMYLLKARVWGGNGIAAGTYYAF